MQTCLLIFVCLTDHPAPSLVFKSCDAIFCKQLKLRLL